MKLTFVAEDSLKQMKVVIRICSILITTLWALPDATAQDGAYTHDRIFLSVSTGVAGGNIKSEVSGQKLETYGTAFGVDGRFGTFLSERVSLSAGFVYTYLPEPRVVVQGKGATDKAEGIGVDEYLFGGGFTWFVNYRDVSLSLLAGAGYVAVKDKEADKSNTSDAGFSFQLKLGKDFWVTPGMTIGLGLMYMKSHIKNEEIETLDTNRFAAMLTFGFD